MSNPNTSVTPQVVCEKQDNKVVSSPGYPKLLDSNEDLVVDPFNQLDDTERKWQIYEGGKYTACGQTTNYLPAGQYTIKFSDSVGIFFDQHEIAIDDLIVLPDTTSEQIVGSIEDFWTKKQQFHDLGFLWKRGVLLYGPQGSGKTSTVQLISQRIVEKSGLAIYVDRPELASNGLQTLREIEPSRPIVVMLEDIDAIIHKHGETDVLAMLDGELQIDNVVIVATTNYPETLDKRVVNRPSRFDIVRKIGMPTAEARKKYLLAKNPRLTQQQDDSEVDLWVEKTSDFSVAHLKEMIISVEVFDFTVTQAASRLREMMNHHPSSEDPELDGTEEKDFGFV